MVLPGARRRVFYLWKWLAEVGCSRGPEVKSQGGNRRKTPIMEASRPTECWPVLTGSGRRFFDNRRLASSRRRPCALPSGRHEELCRGQLQVLLELSITVEESRRAYSGRRAAPFLNVVSKSKGPTGEASRGSGLGSKECQRRLG